MIAILLAYLLGSIPFGFIISRLFGVKDIRTQGSGNIGMTNVWRMVGPVAAFLVFIGDVGKGAFAVLISSYFGFPQIGPEYSRLLAGLAAIIGHIFPVFLKFKGGKGVNTALGVMLILLPLEVLLATAAFIVTVALSRFISLGSLVAASTLLIVVTLEYLLIPARVHPVYLPVAFLLLITILFTHRSNIRRLMVGSENRFSFKSRSEKGILNA